MRDKINVLYYPDMVADQTTLKKAILFFDEIHFMDRPSFTFDGGMGAIGMKSPLREFEQLFRRDNVPIHIHEPLNGRLNGDLLEKISADINDLRFLSIFQEGLRTSETFRLQHIQPGNYADIDTQEVRTEKQIIDLLLSSDISAVTNSHGNAMTLLTDEKIRPFGSTPLSVLKTFIFQAAVCSAKMNNALSLGVAEGFTPLADAAPYGRLLGSKYARAVGVLGEVGNKVPLTDLSFAIFDELVSGEILDKMTFEDVIRYRSESGKARDEFLEYLAILQQKIGLIEVGEEYPVAIGNLIKSEILPAATVFKNKLQTIAEAFYGSLVKGVVSAGGMACGVQVFGDISLGKIIALAGLSTAYVGNAAIDALLAERSVSRDCSLSYVLSLD